MVTITDNSALREFSHKLNGNETLYAVRVKGEIRIYTDRAEYKKDVATNPKAVNGKFTAYNWHWYRF